MRDELPPRLIASIGCSTAVLADGRSFRPPKSLPPDSPSLSPPCAVSVSGSISVASSILLSFSDNLLPRLALLISIRYPFSRAFVIKDRVKNSLLARVASM